MARIGRSLQDLAVEIKRRAVAKRDYVAPATKLAVDVITQADKQLPALVVEGKGSYPLQEAAHAQLAEYAGIPMAYYRRMASDAPELLANNVNRWLRDMGPRARRMVRTLDGMTRALLSDGYRPLENEALAEAVLPVLQDRGLVILSCEITDRRLYLKAVDSAITRHSQEELIPYDRATELERVGGELIELERRDWQRLIPVEA